SALGRRFGLFERGAGVLLAGPEYARAGSGAVVSGPSLPGHRAGHTIAGAGDPEPEPGYAWPRSGDAVPRSSATGHQPGLWNAVICYLPPAGAVVNAPVEAVFCSLLQNVSQIAANE